MKFKGTYLTLGIILVIVLIFIFAINRSSDPIRSLVNQADYMTDGNVSFIEIGTYASSGTKSSTLIVNEIIDKQDVKYAYYNYGVDDLNLMYSQSVECAATFGKRKLVHDFIRENTPSRTDLYVFVKDNRIQIESFQKCLELEKIYENKIKLDNKLIDKLKLNEVSIYIINGEIYEGDVNFNSLSIKIFQSKSL